MELIKNDGDSGQPKCIPLMGLAAVLIAKLRRFARARGGIFGPIQATENVASLVPF